MNSTSGPEIRGRDLERVQVGNREIHLTLEPIEGELPHVNIYLRAHRPGGPDVVRFVAAVRSERARRIANALRRAADAADEAYGANDAGRGVTR